MKAAFLAALLAAIAVCAAGCGNTTETSAALRDARASGGTQARVLRVERGRRIASGDAVDIVLVRARFCATKNGVTMPKINGRGRGKLHGRSTAFRCGAISKRRPSGSPARRITHS